MNRMIECTLLTIAVDQGLMRDHLTAALTVQTAARRALYRFKAKAAQHIDAAAAPNQAPQQQHRQKEACGIYPDRTIQRTGRGARGGVAPDRISEDAE